MQIIYKFRVAFEEHDDVVRFIEIDSTSSFFDLHKIIQESVGFDATKTYEFFMSNDIWRVDNKICSSEQGEKEPSKTILNKFINDPNQKFIYVFDPELNWVFFIELIKVQKAEYGKKYPLIARKEGESPKQYKLKGKEPGATAKNEYDKMAEMLIASRMLENLDKEKPEIIEDDEEIDIDDEEIILDESALELNDADEIEKISKPIIKPDLSLKFDEEELKIDTDDFDFLEEETDESEENENEDDEFGNDYNNSGNFDENYDDY